MLASEYNRLRYRRVALEGLGLAASGAACVGMLGVGPALACACALALSWAAWITGKASYYQITLGTRLKRELGFDYGSYYFGKGLSNALMIASTTPGGIFARAGFRPKDVLLDNLSATDFFRLLADYCGREPIVFHVGSWDGAEPGSVLRCRFVSLDTAGRAGIQGNPKA